MYSAVINSLKVLNIAQPNAHHIFHAGKNIENRSQRTNIRGVVAIYASKTSQSWRFQGFKTTSQECAFGAIIGLVEITDSITEAQLEKPNSWWIGPHGYVLENVFLLPKPVVVTPPKGAIIWWNLSGKDLDKILVQLPPEHSSWNFAK